MSQVSAAAPVSSPSIRTGQSGNAQRTIRRSELAWILLWGALTVTLSAAYFYYAPADREKTDRLAGVGNFINVLSVLGAGVVAVFAYRAVSMQRAQLEASHRELDLSQRQFDEQLKLSKEQLDATRREAAEHTAALQQQNQAIVATTGKLAAATTDMSQSLPAMQQTTLEIGRATLRLGDAASKTETVLAETHRQLNEATTRLGETSKAAALGLTAAVGNTQKLTDAHLQAAKDFMAQVTVILEDRKEEQKLRKESAEAVTAAHKAIKELQEAQRDTMRAERQIMLNRDFFERRRELREELRAATEPVEKAYSLLIDELAEQKRDPKAPLNVFSVEAAHATRARLQARAPWLMTNAPVQCDEALAKHPHAASAIRRVALLCRWIDRHRAEVDAETQSNWEAEVFETSSRHLRVLALYVLRYLPTHLGEGHAERAASLGRILQPQLDGDWPSNLSPADVRT